jgi:hypothetical protein
MIKTLPDAHGRGRRRHRIHEASRRALAWLMSGWCEDVQGDRIFAGDGAIDQRAALPARN